MPLCPGQTLSHYTIVGPLGAGAMGEVWRARDTRLGREVAIKVLPEHFVEDEDRLKRFEREAKTLAALNHTSVAQIFGVDQVGDTCFLVLELVEGETLEERLKRGPLPLEEALDAGRQIAEGLEAAHEAGVIHRDLKPANVRITPEGQVKLLDFGLAKAARAGADAKSTDSVLTTEAGRLLGTPTYMAPEQARGKVIDRRVDIWAFGCVLYECLSGKRAFDGETLSDVLGSVMRDEPDLAALPRATPARVRELVERCLRKDPRQRLRDIGDARLFLATDDGAGASEPVRAGWGRGLSMALLGALLTAVVMLALRAFSGGAAPPPRAPLLRAAIPPPVDASFQVTGDLSSAPQLSPDGRHLAFVAAGRDALSRLWLRELDDLEARPVPGTEGAFNLFWSPDSRSIGFFASGFLRRVDLDGRSAQAICPAPLGKGGSWSRDDVIVFAPDYTGPLHAVAAKGGDSHPVTTLDRERHTTHRYPRFLPDGQRFLYLAANHADALGADSGLYLGSLAGGASDRLLVETRSSAVLVPGRLLYMREGVLLARGFDESSATFTGDPQQLDERVIVDTSTWATVLSASSTGLLVYPDPALGTSGGLQWFDRSGAPGAKIDTEGHAVSLSISPAGERVAVETQVLPTSDIWVQELAGSGSIRLTFDPGQDNHPIWSADGKQIAFSSNRGDGRYRIYVKNADGSGTERKLIEAEDDCLPLDWAPDGRCLLVLKTRIDERAADRSLWIHELEQGTEQLLVHSTGALFAAISPDGRWIAYSFRENDHDEVYVSPMPNGPEGPAGPHAEPGRALFEGGSRWQASRGGGNRPCWTRAGAELLFARPDNVLVALAFDGSGEVPRFGASSALITAPFLSTDPRFSARISFDPSPDGERILAFAPGEDVRAHLVLVTNWTSVLERR